LIQTENTIEMSSQEESNNDEIPWGSIN
jgi:hypothetical protein